jgi:DNA-binding transcriptional LysR family regulator
MRPPLDAYKIHVFLAVVREGGFRAASRTLHLSQPAVTAAVRSLERELEGGPLFERLGRRKRLTERGEALAREAAPLLLRWNEIRDRVEESGDGEMRGTVRVGTGQTIAAFVLPPVLARYRRRAPKVDLVLRVQSRESSWRMLRDGDLDFAVRTAPAIPAGLRFRPLVSVPRVLIAERSVRLPRRPTIEALAEHRFVVPGERSHSRALIEIAFARIHRSLRIGAEAGGFEIVKAAVRAGLGVALLPSLALDARDRRTLRVVPVRHLFPDEEYGLVTRAEGSLSRSAAELLGMIEALQ